MSNVVASVDGHKSHLDGFVVSLPIVAAIHDTKKYLTAGVSLHFTAYVQSSIKRSSTILVTNNKLAKNSYNMQLGNHEISNA